MLSYLEAVLTLSCTECSKDELLKAVASPAEGPQVRTDSFSGDESPPLTTTTTQRMWLPPPQPSLHGPLGFLLALANSASVPSPRLTSLSPWDGGFHLL